MLQPCNFKKIKKNLEDSGKSKNRRKVKEHYWVVGKDIFFLEYKDKNFFCCLQTFFITGLTFFTHPFHPNPEINYWVVRLICVPGRGKHSWGKKS